MTINFVKGNILESNAEALVNPVNCVGVMGKGLALLFKDKYPDNFTHYKDACNSDSVSVGKMFVWRDHNPPNKYVINFPTKRHWRDNSQYTFISMGLVDLVRVVRDLDIKSIVIPQLGCGLGGLDWTIVKPLIVDAFKDMESVEVSIYDLRG